SGIVDVDSLADALISSSDVAIIDAYGFYINGVFQGAISDKTNIENTLDSLLDQYRTGTPGEVVEFVDSFELKPGLYLEDGIIDDSGIIDTLTSEKQVEAYYTVESGDSPLLIAEKVSVPYSELKALNPSIEASCFVGDQVLLNRAQPYADVKVTRTENYDTEIPYETVKVDDANRYKGTETVLINGSNGTAHVVAEVSYVNGYEQSRNIIEQETITEKIDKKVAVGTKKTGASDAAIAAAAGRFLWPVGGSGGYISSGFGNRYLNGKYEFHKGIDIAAAYGTPIYAAADGYVTMSKRNSSYGDCVMLDHGDGYVTLYAHASKLVAVPGTYVKKGDLIALVGNSGYSFGNHLHFEVRYYGTCKNPVNYVKQ
ncbi:MAG: peptidoglycan DD-metalloendopeptidase family protein, partial [Oscillospiraceae bacterium]